MNDSVSIDARTNIRRLVAVQGFRDYIIEIKQEPLGPGLIGSFRFHWRVRDEGSIIEAGIASNKTNAIAEAKRVIAYLVEAERAKVGWVVYKDSGDE